ncbi:MAG: cation diffusion facilitator family transporter [Candidatus Adiutrix sp.]
MEQLETFSDDDHSEALNLSTQISKVTWVGVWVNVVLTALKGVFGYLAGSRALLADAVHSLSDLATDAAILIGVRYWTAPPDDDHPYGHHKIETVVTLAIGVSLGLVGLILGYEAVLSLAKRHGADRGALPYGVSLVTWLALGVTIISIISKEILYRWTAAKGLSIGSSALVANAWHHRSDALSSLPPLVSIGAGAIFGNMGFDIWFLDPVGTIVVCVMLLSAAVSIARPALSTLVDVSADHNLRTAILDTVLSTDGIISAHKLRTRCVGSGAVEVDLHIVVDGNLTVREGHFMAARVKYRILALAGGPKEKKTKPKIIGVVIHVEPDDNG